MKGTPSQGKRKRVRRIVRCRRCGNTAYNLKKSKCTQCGFGN